MLAWIAAHEFTLIGLIWMVVIGPAVGNYACSVVYRLPRGKTPFERHPFCGHCNADLKPIDLFPIWSWVSTRGKCRYCKGEIPSIYTVIEAVCGIVFIAYFLHFGVGEAFILYATYAVFVVILASIQWQQGWVAATIYSYAFICLALVRVLQEHSIYGIIQSAFLMLLAAILAHRISKHRQESPFEKPWIWWWVLLGAIVPVAEWQLLAPILLLQWLAPKESRVIVYSVATLTLPLLLA